jgi:hypothetical protein
MVTRKDSTEETKAVLEAWQQGNEGQGIAVTVYTHNEGPGRTPILPAHLTPWWFGMSFDGNEWDMTGKPTGAEWWWRLTQTTLRLMQQKIAAHHEERPERAARREAQRLRFPAQTVKVVRLRRESSEYTGPPSESANYSHRFIVGGHWRWQPYGDGIRRQIWIGDYVKGPEDKPLIIKPRRAFTWDR